MQQSLKRHREEETKNDNRNMTSTEYNKSKAINSFSTFIASKIISEYDQEIPQSQTADNPVQVQFDSFCE